MFIIILIFNSDQKYSEEYNLNSDLSSIRQITTLVLAGEEAASIFLAC
jgi:hypothetical protein